MIGLLPPRSTPASVKILWISSCDRILPSGVRSESKGTLRAPGMWPPRRPARGSGAVPQNRPLALASTTCEAGKCGRRGRRGGEDRKVPAAPEERISAAAHLAGVRPGVLDHVAHALDQRRVHPGTVARAGLPSERSVLQGCLDRAERLLAHTQRDEASALSGGAKQCPALHTRRKSVRGGACLLCRDLYVVQRLARLHPGLVSAIEHRYLNHQKRPSIGLGSIHSSFSSTSSLRRKSPLARRREEQMDGQR